MKRLPPQSAGPLVLFTFGTLCVILLLIGGLFSYSLQTIEQHNEAQQAAVLDAIQIAEKLAKEVGMLQADAIRHALAVETADRDRSTHAIDRRNRVIAKQTAELQPFMTTPAEWQAYADVEQARQRYAVETRALLTLDGVRSTAEAINLALAQQTPAHDKYQKAINTLADSVDRKGAATTAAMAKFISQTKRSGNLLGATAIVIVVWTGFVMARVTRRLNADNQTLQTEVAERQRNAEALRQSEAQSRAIIDTAHDAFISINGKGYIVEWNRQAEVIFGWPRSEVLGRLLHETIIPPRYWETHLRGLKHYLATGEGSVLNRRIEFPALRRNGEEFLVELAIWPSHAGDTTMFNAFVRDIAEHKRLTGYLSAQTAVRLILAESTSLAGAMPRVLQTLCEMLGWDFGAFWSLDPAVQGLRCVEIWHAPHVPADELIRESRRRTFARGIGLPGRVWDGGQPVWIADVIEDVNYPRASVVKRAGLHASFGFPILSAYEVAHVIEFFSRDIRQPDEDLLRMFANIGNLIDQFLARAQLENHLIQSQRMETVGRLAGGVAHEFNGIMTTIIGQSELLLGSLSAGDPQRERAGEIRAAADHAARLTRQLLAYGRRQMLRPEILDLNKVVGDMEKMIRHLVGETVTVQFLAVPGLKSTRADLGQIEQVIINLSLNAAAAMPTGGQLTLATAPVTLDAAAVSRFPELSVGEYVTLAITDTGTGMSTEVQAHLFEPFFTTKDVGKGTGLGLATCQGIIKQSGGHIHVDSELGHGTTFKIYLPAVADAAPAGVPGPASLPSGSETIVLVENDPTMRKMAAALLERLGYTVLAATTGDEALAAIRPSGVDLLITDVVLPQMSGKELADRIRALSRRMPRILYMSAYAQNAIVHRGALDDDTAFLQKPFTPAALATKVRKTLDR